MIHSLAVIKMKQKMKGIIALLVATLIWGSTFVAQSVGLDLVEPFSFQVGRTVLAVPFMLILLLIQNPKEFLSSWKNPQLWKAGIPCGIALFAASGLQQMGMVHTDAGKSGFLTAMYIILVPILGIFLKRKPPKTIYFSVVLAVAGLYLLSCVGVTTINSGDIMLLGCALAFAFQILFVEIFGEGLNGIQLNCAQCIVNGILSAIVMLLFEEPKLSALTACWLPLAYAGILSMGVAFTLQIVGQKYLEAAPASIIMSLESVFAVLAGWLILGETMTTAETIGCILMFAAVILSQLPVPMKKKSKA